MSNFNKTLEKLQENTDTKYGKWNSVKNASKDKIANILRLYPSVKIRRGTDEVNEYTSNGHLIAKHDLLSNEFLYRDVY